MARHGDTLTEDLKRIERHYAELVERHGSAPEAAQWSDARTQRLRLRVLSEVADLRAAKVLDFGCGTGTMLAYLRKSIGFDGRVRGLRPGGARPSSSPRDSIRRGASSAVTF